jgi:hypothetical protein
MGLFKCSFCLKTEKDKIILIVGPEGVCICSECIELASEIILKNKLDNK